MSDKTKNLEICIDGSGVEFSPAKRRSKFVYQPMQE